VGVHEVNSRPGAIFFDRDGVLNNAIVKNGKPYPPASLAELTIPDDAIASLTALKVLGFKLIGVTNQPDVARGTTTLETVEEINAELMGLLPLDDIRVCYHDDADQCDCRKPLPGLLTTAAQDYDIKLEQSFMVGDRWKDIDAGLAAGCKTIWLNKSYDERGPSKVDFTAETLKDAVVWILRNISSKK
jgi:D-glycero-D-manno-heptose 1,7-bisphosphate phosphatase